MTPYQFVSPRTGDFAVNGVRIQRRPPCEHTICRAQLENVFDSPESEPCIRTKIVSDAALKATIEVTADAARNAATLFGIVASEAIRHRAIELTGAAIPDWDL